MFTGHKNCFLVRHTETDWNVEGRYSGQSDIPGLTANGIFQAFELSREFRSYNVWKVICSDLRRARDVALMIAGPHGLKPVVDPRLREVSLGRMDGLLKQEARARYADDRFSTRSPSFDFSELGGESRQSVLARHCDLFDELILPNPHRHIVVVGHGTALRVFLQSRGLNVDIVQGSFVPIRY